MAFEMEFTAPPEALFSTAMYVTGSVTVEIGRVKVVCPIVGSHVVDAGRAVHLVLDDESGFVEAAIASGREPRVS
jgi:hypothetical protein